METPRNKPKKTAKTPLIPMMLTLIVFASSAFFGIRFILQEYQAPEAPQTLSANVSSSVYAEVPENPTNRLAMQFSDWEAAIAQREQALLQREDDMRRMHQRTLLISLSVSLFLLLLIIINYVRDAKERGYDHRIFRKLFHEQHMVEDELSQLEEQLD